MSDTARTARTRTILAGALGEGAVVIAFVLDVLVGVDWSSGAVTAMRVVAVAGAAVVAVVYYAHWASAAQRLPATHAAMVFSLLGGAFVVSSVFGEATGRVFAHESFGSIGVAAVVVACALGAVSLSRQGAAS